MRDQPPRPRTPVTRPGARAATALRQIVQALRLSASAAERSAGLSSARLLVLRVVAAEPGLSLSAVMERTLTDLSSVSVVVRDLVAQGLVARRRSRDDSRRAALEATAAGRRRLRSAPRPAQEPLLAALRRMPAADADRLATLLSSLAAAMGARGRPPMLFADGDRRRRSPTLARSPRA